MRHVECVWIIGGWKLIQKRVYPLIASLRRYTRDTVMVSVKVDSPRLLLLLASDSLVDLLDRFIPHPDHLRAVPAPDQM